MTTQIYRDKKGWREVNPHRLHITPSFDWTDFEQSIQYHQFPNAPDVAEGVVVEAYLQWQRRWEYDICDEPDDYKWVNCEKPEIFVGLQIRAIWILADKQATKEEIKPGSDKWYDGQDNDQPIKIIRNPIPTQEVKGVEEAAQNHISTKRNMTNSEEKYYLQGALFGATYQSQQTSNREKELVEENERYKEALLKIVHGSSHEAYTIAKEALKVKP